MSNETLVQKIIEASQAYYSGESIIPDKEFDNLVAQLKKLQPDHPILSTIGWGYKPMEGVKFQHYYMMGSLDKVKIDDLGSKSGKYDLATPKIDGASISAYYENGYLKRIVSRGNGEIGIEVTSNLIHAVPIFIKGMTGKKVVRGEAVITVEDFEIVGGKSPRNSANGLVQSKMTSDKTKYLRFITYSIPWSDTSAYLSKAQQLSCLTEWGFEVVSATTKCSERDLIKSFTGRATLKDGKTVMIDGMVLSSNITKITELKSGYSFENDSIAVKFHEEVAESTVTAIEWSTGRTGKVVPVIVIKPINLAGATITRSSGYNVRFIEEGGIGPGAIVKIVRANEVIPKVIETVKTAPVRIPTSCPQCGAKLTRTESGIELMCPNPDCPAKLDEVIIEILKLTQPDGIGGVNIEQLVDEIKTAAKGRDVLVGYLRSLNDMIENSTSSRKLLDYQYRYGQCMGKLVHQMLVDLKTFQPTISQVVKCANIPGVGNTASEALNIMPLKDFLKENIDNKWMAVLPNEPSRINIVKYWSRVNLLKDFFVGRIKDMSKVEVTQKIKVAVTGALSVTRNEWYSMHKKLEAGGVSKGTMYLVTNEPSGSAKYVAATKLGIPIVTEEEFDKIYPGL